MKKALFLVTGWAGNCQTFRRLVDIAPADWEVVVVPYHEIFPLYKNERTEDKLAQIIEPYNCDQVRLAGVSIGGEACIKFASRWPNRVETLILIDSCGIKMRHPVRQIFRSIFSLQTFRGMGRLRKEPSRFHDFVKKPFFYLRIIRHFLSLDLEEEMRSIKAPTVVLWGEDDKLISKEQGEKIHHLIPYSRWKVLVGMDHAWSSHSPEQFWANI